MIHRVCRKILAALLIIGWVNLSGFDLLEDFDDISSQAAVSSALPKDNSKSKLGGWRTLANNIVESAVRIVQDYSALLTFTAIIFDLDAFLDFRRHFPFINSIACS
jgi:hypothetical protein